MKPTSERIDQLTKENEKLRAVVAYQRQELGRERREIRHLSRALERKAQEVRVKDREMADTWKKHREAMARLGLGVNGKDIEQPRAVKTMTEGGRSPIVVEVTCICGETYRRPGAQPALIPCRCGRIWTKKDGIWRTAAERGIEGGVVHNGHDLEGSPA